MSEHPSLPSPISRGIPRAVLPSSAATGLSITPKEIIGVLRRRLWLIMSITFLFAIGSVVLWFVEKRYHPGYTSVGLVQCLMPIQPDILGGGQTLPNDRIIALQTQSRAMDLKSDGFLRRVIKRTRVQATSWISSFNKDHVKIMDAFKDNFSVRPQRDSEFIVVSMTAPNASEAQLILNEALDEFLNQMKEVSDFDLRGDLEALTNERAQLGNRIEQKRRDLARLRTQVNVPGIEQGQTVVSQEMNMMHLEKLRLQALLQEVTYQQQFINENGGMSNQVMMAVEQDPVVMGLRNRIIGLNEEITRMLKELGDEHLDVKQIKARIQILQQQLNDRQAQLQQQFSVSQQTQMQRQAQALQLELNTVNDQYENAVSEQKDIEIKQANYLVAREELDFLNSTLERFDQKIDSTKLAMRSQAKVRVKVEHGNEPLVISYPNLKVFLPGGLVLGLLVSVGLVFLLEFMDDSIKSPSDVARYLRIPMLGMVPEYDEDDADQIDIAKLAALKPHTMFSDSYRQVRTNLFFSAPAEELKSILVTSCTAECGKTVTAVNLAITISTEGKRVLLVDANFRRAALNHLFPVEGTPKGLSHVLVGHAAFEDAVRHSGIKGLDIVDSGPLPPNPADLLDSPRMKEFIERQKGLYDHIIFDGPPALLFSDATILASSCDGVLLVVHAHDTARGMVLRMIRDLNTPSIRILGVVLNAVRPRKGGYFHETYESYNEYMQNAESTSLLTAVEEK